MIAAATILQLLNQRRFESAVPLTRQMLVEAACQFLPQATVSEVLMGSPPR